MLAVLAAAIQVAGLLILRQLGLLTASSARWVLGLAGGMAAAGWLTWMRPSFQFRRLAVLDDLRHNWDFGKWVFASGVVWSATTYLFPWVLVAFHGAAAGGVWAACFGVIGLANPVLMGVQNFLGPSIAHGFADQGSSGMGRYTRQAVLISAAVLLPLLLVFTFLGGQLVVLLFGAKYAGNHLVIAVLGANLVVGASGFVVLRMLFAMERARCDFLANVAGLAALSGCGLPLASRFGPLGTACGLLICSVVSSVVAWPR